MEINKSKGVIEAILFAAGREVKITELMSALEAELRRSNYTCRKYEGRL